MKKQQVLDSINKAILSEYGKAVSINCLFTDSQLDSLGMTLCVMQIDSQFCILNGKPKDISDSDYLDLPNITVRDLISKCISSSTQDFTD